MSPNTLSSPGTLRARATAVGEKCLSVFPGSLQPHVSRLFVFILFQVNLLQADQIMAKHSRAIRFKVSELERWRQQFHVNGGMNE